MALNKCPECGKEISDIAKECTNCRISSSVDEMLQEVGKRINKGLGFAVITFIIMFILIGIAYIYPGTAEIIKYAGGVVIMIAFGVVTYHVFKK